MKKVTLYLLFTLIMAAPLYAESLTLSTYYPAPFGAYDRLRLVPRSAAGMTCNAATAGTFFVEITTNKFRFCEGSAYGPPLGVWTQNTSNQVFLTDIAINPNLNVGIGTTAPTEKLHVVGTFSLGPTNDPSTKRLNFDTETSPIAKIWTSNYFLDLEAAGPTSNDIRFFTGTTAGAGTQRMIIDQAGNVGIGTTEPGAKLEVAGNIRSNSGTPLSLTRIGTGTYNQTVLYHDATFGYMLERARTTDSPSGTIIDWSINQRGGGTPALIVKGSGNVGIGTTSPGQKLEVDGDVKVQDKIIVGVDPNSQLNSGEAWLFRAADRQDGTLTVQLGGNSAVGTRFEIVDRVWTKVISSISGEAPESSFNIQADGDAIFNGGNVGIGTTGPGQKLQVNGNVFVNGGKVTAGGGTNNGNTSGVWFWSDTDSNHVMYSASSSSGIRPGGSTAGDAPDSILGGAGQHRLRFRTATGQGWLFENNANVGVIDFDSDDGSAYFTGTVSAGAFVYNSDKSLKKNIRPVSGLDGILKLSGVKYEWKKNGTTDIGVVAQNIEDVYPELVMTDATGQKGVKYGNLIAPLIEAVKEQQKIIEEQNKKIEVLRDEMEILKDAIPE